MKRGSRMFRTEARGKIYGFIRGSPGSHLREIGRRLGMSLGHLRYHLNILEKKNLVFSVKNGHYRRYFVRKDFDAGLVGLFFVLRQKNPRRIVLHLLTHRGVTRKELLRTFGFPSSTLSLYLNNLVKRGVVERVKNGRTHVYRIINEENVIELLRTYKESFLDRLVDGALEVYEETHL